MVRYVHSMRPRRFSRDPWSANGQHRQLYRIHSLSMKTAHGCWPPTAICSTWFCTGTGVIYYRHSFGGKNSACTAGWKTKQRLTFFLFRNLHAVLSTPKFVNAFAFSPATHSRRSRRRFVPSLQTRKEVRNTQQNSNTHGFKELPLGNCDTKNVCVSNVRLNVHIVSGDYLSRIF